MTDALTSIALVAPAALLGASLFSRRKPSPATLRAATVAAAWTGVAVAVVLAALAAGKGPLGTPLLGAGGLGLSLRVDALSVTIFAMVSLLAVVILRFSSTYLDGDDRQHVFLGRMTLTIASVELLVLSGNLVLFSAAWIATSLCLHTLLVFYPGDVCILGASALLYSAFGTGELGAIFEQARSGARGVSLEAAAGLIAMAALFKAAQFPTHGWLVEVMETPTPVSALLHAGILNAGPFLVLRFASVMELGFVSAGMLVVGGGLTALFASVVLLTQPSVKVALGYSSAAHMGFMLLVCGLGVYPAAVLHLVAHSFYKAHAFLSSGSVVDSVRAKKVAVPRRLRSPARIGVSVALAGGIFYGVGAGLGFSVAENPSLLAVGAILVMGLTQLLAPSIDSAGTAAAMSRTIGLAGVVTMAFFALEEGARLLLLDSLPPAQAPSTAVSALTIAVLLGFAGAVALQVRGLSPGSRLRHRMYIAVRNGFYANAALDRLVGAYRI